MLKIKRSLSNEVLLCVAQQVAKPTYVLLVEVITEYSINGLHHAHSCHPEIKYPPTTEPPNAASRPPPPPPPPPTNTKRSFKVCRLSLQHEIREQEISLQVTTVLRGERVFLSMKTPPSPMYILTSVHNPQLESRYMLSDIRDDYLPTPRLR